MDDKIYVVWVAPELEIEPEILVVDRYKYNFSFAAFT